MCQMCLRVAFAEPTIVQLYVIAHFTGSSIALDGAGLHTVSEGAAHMVA